MRVGDYTKEFPNLPGSVVDVKDGVGGLNTQNTTGDEVVLVGTALDGPKLEPVNVDSYEQIEDIFGKYYGKDGTRNGATLPYAAKRMLEAGADNVSLLRMSGELADAEIPVDGYFETTRKKEREYFGEALGNKETTIDLLDEVPDSLKDDYRVNNVVVIVDGNQLAARHYSVDNSNGIVTIKEGSTDSKAPVRIEYQLVEIRTFRPGYLPQKTDGATNTEEASFTSGTNNFVLDQPYAVFQPAVCRVHTEDVSTGQLVNEFDIIPTSEANNYSQITEDSTTKLVFDYPSTLGANEARVRGYHLDTNNNVVKTEVKFGADLDLTNTALKVNYLYATGSGVEKAELTSQASKRQFEVNNDNLVPGSELILKSVYNDSLGEFVLKLLIETDEFSGNASENANKYKIDYETGMITTGYQVDTDNGEEIYVAYRYEDNLEEYREKSGSDLEVTNGENGVTVGQSMFLPLEHNASNKDHDEFKYPVTLLANGEEVTKDAYEVDFDSIYKSTVITVKPGFIEQGAELEAVYYWMDEEYVEPTIDIKAANPGSLYNQARVVIEDELFEKQSQLKFDGYNTDYFVDSLRPFTKDALDSGETETLERVSADSTNGTSTFKVAKGTLADVNGGADSSSQNPDITFDGNEPSSYTINSWDPTTGEITFNSVYDKGSFVATQYKYFENVDSNLSGELTNTETLEPLNAWTESSTEYATEFAFKNNDIIDGSITWASAVSGAAKTVDYEDGTVTFTNKQATSDVTANQYKWNAETQVISNMIEPEFLGTNSATGEYVYQMPPTINVGTSAKPFEVKFGGLAPTLNGLQITQYDGTDIPLQGPSADIDINYSSGTFACSVAPSANQPGNDTSLDGPGLIVAHCLFKTESDRISFAPSFNQATGSSKDGEVLERVTRTKFKFSNDNLVRNTQGIGNNPLDIYIDRNTQNAPEDLELGTDYTVNWSSGIVYLNSNKALGAKDKLVCRRYAYYNIEGKKLTIKKPDAKTGPEESKLIEFSLGNEINTIGGLADAVNTHQRNNVLRFKITSDLYAKSVMQLKTPPDETTDYKVDGNIYNGLKNKKRVPLSGGDDGIHLTKEQIYDKLGGKTDVNGEKLEYGAYDILLEYEPADIIVPVGVYANDDLAASYKNFANQLTQFLAKCFYNSNEVRGMIGVNPIEDTSRISVIDRVKKLNGLQTLFFLQDENRNVVKNQQDEPVDVGKFLSIVGHDVAHTDQNLGMTQVVNGAPEYAAIASMISNDTAPTNEDLPVSLAYTYSKRQANTLSGNRIVTFKDDNGTAKITDSPTCAFPNSGWERYLTSDVVFGTMDRIREIYDRYIGEGNSLEKRNSLKSELRKELKNNEMLKDFDYNIRMSQQDEFMGRMVVELELVPVTELRKIYTVVSINAQL